MLTPEIFEQLRRNISDHGKEIELTTALEQVRQNIGMMGVALNGKMYDMGNPSALRNTMIYFGNV